MEGVDAFMDEVAQRLALSSLIHAPAAALLFGAAWSFRAVATRYNWPGANGRALYLVILASAGVQITGFAAIGTRWEDVARVSTIYPGSAAFLLLPTVLLDRLPDATLPFLGATSATTLTAAVPALIWAVCVVSKEWAAQQRVAADEAVASMEPRR